MSYLLPLLNRVTLMTYQVVVGVRYPELVLPSSPTWGYLVWGCRENGGFVLVDTNSNDYLALTAETYFRPLGLQHFYAGFALDTNVVLRDDALCNSSLTKRTSHLILGCLTKRWGNHIEQPTDQIGIPDLQAFL